MSISLVLWWWGARGLAHIWVYRAITELGIQIDEVVGTSAGSIVWSAIALGQRPDEILQYRHDTKLRKMADIRIWKVSVREGIVRGDQMRVHLDDMYAAASFADTRIPLKVIATDAHTGDPVVFTSGSIAHAVMASSSFPWVFASYRDESWEYIDGGLCANLPLGYTSGDRIIASSVQWPYDQFTTWSGTLHQMESLMAMMIRQQELRDIHIYARENQLQVISPDVQEIWTFSFARSDWIVEQGYLKAMDVLR